MNAMANQRRSDESLYMYNIADPFSDFFPFKKAPKPSFWKSPVLLRKVLLSQRAHTSLSLAASAQFLFSERQRGAAL